ncbi:MAG: trimethylamine methyltransferase family protein [Pseudomonadota bacterium]
MADPVERKPRRRASGGRAERLAARAAPLSASARPVRPGLSGGQYRPLSDAEVQRIHSAALDVLEQVGFRNTPPSGVEVMTKAGATLGDDGRLRFPRALVEDMLAVAARDITLPGRDPEFDLDLSGNRVHFGPAGAAVQMVETETGTYRDSTLTDLYEAAALSHALDNIHFFQRAIIARELTDNLSLDLNSVYACMAGTSKHIGTAFTTADTVPRCLELIHAVAGGEDTYRARPFISNTNCFVVPPLTFAADSCDVLEAVVRAGMPVLLLSAGQAGATAPAPLAAAIVQAVAECLAGIVYVNSIVPGHPAILGTWPFVSDLRTGAMSGGSGEQALLTAACAQMHKFYGLPGGAAAGIADAKLPDMQAGWEQAVSNVMAGLSGLNMVYEAAGMHASLMGFCQESLILGNDMLGQVQRCVRGIEVTEDTIGVDVIKSVCLGGPGHYLGEAQTLALMQSEYIYPDIADRTSPKEWVERGCPDLVQQARARRRAIMADAQPKFDADLHTRLTSDFDLSPLWPVEETTP